MNLCWYLSKSQGLAPAQMVDVDKDWRAYQNLLLPLSEMEGLEPSSVNTCLTTWLCPTYILILT